MSRQSVSVLFLVLTAGIAATIAANPSWADSKESPSILCQIFGGTFCDAVPKVPRFETRGDKIFLVSNMIPQGEPLFDKTDNMIGIPADRAGHIECREIREGREFCKLKIWNLSDAKSEIELNFHRPYTTSHFSIRGEWIKSGVALTVLKAPTKEIVFNDGKCIIGFRATDGQPGNPKASCGQTNVLVKGTDVSGRDDVFYNNILELVSVVRK
jgi:hypothetical protein